MALALTRLVGVPECPRKSPRTVPLHGFPDIDGLHLAAELERFHFSLLFALRLAKGLICVSGLGILIYVAGNARYITRALAFEHVLFYHWGIPVLYRRFDLISTTVTQKLADVFGYPWTDRANATGCCVN